MIRWLAFFLCFPCVALAEPVAIRSGEHGSFSRFVIDIGSGTDWAIRRTDGGFLLSLTGRADGFDTSTIFDRIPRTRVSNVIERTPSVLFIATDCACDADGFLWQADKLVIDIKGEDPQTPPQPALASATRPVARQPSNAPLRLPDLGTLSMGSGPVAVASIAFDNPVPVRPADQATAPAEASMSAAPAGIAPAAPPESDLAEAEAALIEGLARAASQGFLEAAVTSPTNQSDEGHDPTRNDLPALTEPAQPRQPGIGISTAMDRDLAGLRDVLNSQVGPQCLPADLFGLDRWGNGQAFHVQAAALAEALAGEFGAQPREAQENLARLYLHFGFGAEARVVLAADTTQSQDRTVLDQLAGIIDDYEGEYALISAQAGCDTPGALWAFLVSPSDLLEEEQNKILQAFFTLPQPLRGQIAPRLSRKFVAVGLADAADRLLRATENNDAEATHETASAHALVAEELDRPEDAFALLAKEAADNARTTPASLIRLIELGVEAGVDPAEADLILAGAMRQEHRGTPVADQLAVAEAAGRTQLGQYRAAIDLLQDLDLPAAFEGLNSTFTSLAADAPAATFLTFAFGELPQGVTPEIENLMARRLIDLGFPERATALLDGPAQRANATERRFLRAEAAIGTTDYTKAIDALLGMSDPRANALRARAFAGLGEHRAALSAQPVDEDSTAAATLQFRAGAWERLTDDGDPVLSSFAQTVLAPPAEAAPQTLADRRAVLAQSQESRRAVEDLLSRFDGETSLD